MVELVYVTGNKSKVAAAKVCMEPLGIKIIQKDLDIPEIQADTNEEVAMEASKLASSILKMDCVKNDGGLIIPALNGFPGPYTKYVEQTLGENGIISLMKGIKNREAYWIEAWGYTEYGKDPVVFIGKFEGTISEFVEGENGYGYDKIFIPKGETHTMACMSDEDRLKFWCSDAHVKLLEHIKKVKNLK